MDKSHEHRCDMSKVWVERPEKDRLALDTVCHLAGLGLDRTPLGGPGPRDRTFPVAPNPPPCRLESPLRRALGWFLEAPRPPVAMHEVQTHVAMSRPASELGAIAAVEVHAIGTARPQRTA